MKRTTRDILLIGALGFILANTDRISEYITAKVDESLLNKQTDMSVPTESRYLKLYENADVELKTTIMQKLRPDSSVLELILRDFSSQMPLDYRFAATYKLHYYNDLRIVDMLNREIQKEDAPAILWTELEELLKYHHPSTEKPLLAVLGKNIGYSFIRDEIIKFNFPSVTKLLAEKTAERIMNGKYMEVCPVFQSADVTGMEDYVSRKLARSLFSKPDISCSIWADFAYHANASGLGHYLSQLNRQWMSQDCANRIDYALQGDHWRAIR